MHDKITDEANKIATFAHNPQLTNVIQEYLRFQYIEHKKLHNKCKCPLCYEIKQVTFWHRQVAILDHNGWKGGWQSAGPAYINAMKFLRLHRQKRDELKNKISTYRWEENPLD